MKIKILHIIKTLAFGGAEVNLLNLVQAADHSRFDIYIAYSVGGELEEKFIQSGVKLFKFSDKSCKLKSPDTFGIIFKLARFIRKNNIQVIQTHTFNTHVWGTVAAKLTGAKIVEHVHDSRYLDPEEFDRRGEKSRQYKMIKRFRNVSDRVVVLTKQNHDFVVSNRINRPEYVREIFNGIPLNRGPGHTAALQGWREKLAISPEAKVVVTPIRFSPEKNTELLIHITSNVVKEFPQCVFIIAGEGPLLEGFRGKVRAAGLENNVKLPGFMSNINQLFSEADIFLLPSKLELHSIAILEAMSMKVPVVVSKNVGCNDEFIQDWQNGVLLDPFSDEGWSDALIRLLKDASLRQRIGEAGFKTCCERFDIKDTVKKFEELYAELVKF